MSVSSISSDPSWMMDNFQSDEPSFKMALSKPYILENILRFIPKAQSVSKRWYLAKFLPENALETEARKKIDRVFNFCFLLTHYEMSHFASHFENLNKLTHLLIKLENWLNCKSHPYYPLSQKNVFLNETSSTHILFLLKCLLNLDRKPSSTTVENILIFLKTISQSKENAQMLIQAGAFKILMDAAKEKIFALQTQNCITLQISETHLSPYFQINCSVMINLLKALPENSSLESLNVSSEDLQSFIYFILEKWKTNNFEKIEVDFFLYLFTAFPNNNIYLDKSIIDSLIWKLSQKNVDFDEVEFKTFAEQSFQLFQCLASNNQKAAEYIIKSKIKKLRGISIVFSLKIIYDFFSTLTKNNYKPSLQFMEFILNKINTFDEIERPGLCLKFLKILNPCLSEIVRVNEQSKIKELFRRNVIDRISSSLLQCNQRLTEMDIKTNQIQRLYRSVGAPPRCWKQLHSNYTWESIKREILEELVGKDVSKDIILLLSFLSALELK